MPKCRMMGAGLAGSLAYKDNTNGNQGGGNKKQGLAPTTNKAVEFVLPAIQNRAYGENRNLVFCMNQLGGVGAAGIANNSRMFATTADGVKNCVPTHPKSQKKSTSSETKNEVSETDVNNSFLNDEVGVTDRNSNYGATNALTTTSESTIYPSLNMKIAFDFTDKPESIKFCDYKIRWYSYVSAERDFEQQTTDLCDLLNFNSDDGWYYLDFGYANICIEGYQSPSDPSQTQVKFQIYKTGNDADKVQYSLTMNLSEGDDSGRLNVKILGWNWSSFYNVDQDEPTEVFLTEFWNYAKFYIAVHGGAGEDPEQWLEVNTGPCPTDPGPPPCDDDYVC